MILPTQMSIGKALGQEVPICSLCNNKAEYFLCAGHILWMEDLEIMKQTAENMINSNLAVNKKYWYTQLETIVKELNNG